MFGPIHKTISIILIGLICLIFMLIFFVVVRTQIDINDSVHSNTFQFMIEWEHLNDWQFWIHFKYSTWSGYSYFYFFKHSVSRDICEYVTTVIHSPCAMWQISTECLKRIERIENVQFHIYRQTLYKFGEKDWKNGTKNLQSFLVLFS